MNESEKDKTLTIQGASSFLIKIQYRQNASWQGVIQWLDGRKARHFRSFLELVMLMQEALLSSDKDGETIKLNTWDDREEVS